MRIVWETVRLCWSAYRDKSSYSSSLNFTVTTCLIGLSTLGLPVLVIVHLLHILLILYFWYYQKSILFFYKVGSFFSYSIFLILIYKIHRPQFVILAIVVQHPFDYIQSFPCSANTSSLVFSFIFLSCFFKCYVLIPTESKNHPNSLLTESVDERHSAMSTH